MTFEILPGTRSRARRQPATAGPPSGSRALDHRQGLQHFFATVRGPWWRAGLISLLASGCATVKRTAVNQLGNALAEGGATFGSDDDPELIKAAVPFSLKLMESLLAESPRHVGLLFATASGFTQYAYAFVQAEAEEREETDFTASAEIKERARRLYLRARDYGLRGLEVNLPGMGGGLRRNPRVAVRAARVRDVPLMYWTAVSWAAAISLAKDNPDLVADLPIVEALIDRALELDEAFDRGAIHGFLVTYEMSRPNVLGEPADRAKLHFNRAVELSGGGLAGPYLAYAEAVALQKQDLEAFRGLLQRALAIDPEAKPEWRLVNRIMQRRARWLLAHLDQLFLKKNSA